MEEIIFKYLKGEGLTDKNIAFVMLTYSNIFRDYIAERFMNTFTLKEIEEMEKVIAEKTLNEVEALALYFEGVKEKTQEDLFEKRENFWSDVYKNVIAIVESTKFLGKTLKDIPENEQSVFVEKFISKVEAIIT